MMRRLLAATLVAAVTVPAAAQEAPRARRERDRGDRPRIEVLGPELIQIEGRRARLGVLVDLRPDPARDSIGARIAGVTPGGPADRAGVRTGDLVTRLNGTRLAATESRRGDDDEDDDDEESAPGLRLIRLASRLDPGDTVRLDLRRDGRNLTLTFQAEESDVDRIVRRFEMRAPEPPSPAIAPVPPEPGAPFRAFAFGDRLSDLELVRLNAGLGEYFGTSEGLLVVDVGSDTSLGLRAGDVIVSVGGRRPNSPSHALRILSTYEGGETVSFEILRQRRRQSVSGRMPESRFRWRVSPNQFELHLMPELRLRELQERMHQLRMLPDRMWERMRFHWPDFEFTPGRKLIRTDGEV
jgi:membrane-associated protease RseP (regulator of RpoE activity)